ncbi:glycoside hydrolase family 88 protein [Paenibacillus sp. PL2-23]|uniref:glycoside hydrolase family 88/105 protein n=1 Tax=Paenibacillus sp. PL2-23 TaxID=2100729 RepID=UPI0030F79322
MIHMQASLTDRESARYWFGNDSRRILEVLAARYTGVNPPVPFALRAFSKAGILQTEEGLYEINLAERLPEAGKGHYAYACGLVWSDDERSIDGVMQPLGPVTLYMNEERIYRSTVVEEMEPHARAIIPILLRKGWNKLLIEAKKTAAGFGCRFGADEGKVRILNVLSPFSGRAGHAGWVYSESVNRPLFGEGAMPAFDQTEEETGLLWQPRARWTDEDALKPNLERLFGRPTVPVAGYGWARLPQTGRQSIVVEGHACGPSELWLDDERVFELPEAGTFRTSIRRPAGGGQLLIRTLSSPQGWGFELHATADGQPLPLELPIQVHGYEGPWLYRGPIDADAELNPSEVCCTHTLLPAVHQDGSPAGLAYWELDAPHTRLRPYYENAMLSNKWTTGSATNFGRWDYPLGVTMYGLLRSAKALNRQDLAQYALEHIRSCTRFYDYSLWDREAYGFPAINHQLVLMRMLDNCGSFGSAMLEAYSLAGDASFLRIADKIGDFMLGKLERTEDGAFYRLSEGEYFDQTMWADDLYMSAPFLTRYALVSGKQHAMDEAAKQFLLFRRYLFLEEEGIMSHVYDFKYGQATKVPWGRGNGWVLFSLSELLEHLPRQHVDREELLRFFRDMCAGVARLQSESGLWRQVLNEPDAYEEASCTAMFAYAFARGVRFGWLDQQAARYSDAALKAWRGLASSAIDRSGNVHGVCSGSRYSFSPDYYMYDLRTVVNDNHGIGIMMLAGVEIASLKMITG